LPALNTTENNPITFQTAYSEAEIKSLLASWFKSTLGDIGMTKSFSGLFISDDQFEIRSKWEMTFSARPYKKKPYIGGRILTADGKILVQLTYYPSVFLSWYLLLPMILPWGLIGAGIYTYKNEYMILAGVGAMFFLLLIYAVAFAIVKSILTGQITALLSLKL
jgi:hypothetical protein